VLDVDLLTVAAHKFEGPKGVRRALFIRHGTNILAQQQGGAQERYRRAGTENVAGAVGMATALELAVSERSDTVGRLRDLRDSLAAALLQSRASMRRATRPSACRAWLRSSSTAPDGSGHHDGPGSRRTGLLDRVGVRQWLR
jgi:cysteine desulfurase